MFNSENGSLENTTICPSCGRLSKMEQDNTANKSKGILYTLMGWLFCMISLVFIPILFGALAFSMGLITYFERSKAHGTVLMVFATMGLIIGSLISFMVAGTMFF